MAEKKFKYSIGYKTKYRSYGSTVKEMTEKQFDAYYDKIVADGGKVISIFKDEISN